MHRVFLPVECFAEAEVVVSGSERRHLADSLRVRAGERFLATDGNGHEYILETRKVDRRELICAIVDRTEKPDASGTHITVAVAPPRGGRMEIAIEKCVECGVARIVPLRSARSVLRGRDDSARAERWLRVARSAIAQSGRTRLPEIAPVADLSAALAAAADTRLLLAHPGPEAVSVATALADAAAHDPVTIFIGPEGGFTDEETEEGRRFGAAEVSLGATRLRTETAAIVAVALARASLSA